MKKIVTILGARPQFIKAAAVSRAIRLLGSDCLEELIVHTGQHYDVNMSDLFFTEMDIPLPRYRLQIPGGLHGKTTGRMLEKLEELLLEERPDAVVVYGDTNTTLAGALAAKKLHLPLIHIESGLRSYNMQMPEEINRILTDRISDLLFCPTEAATNNLIREGFGNFGQTIVQSGDVMYDGALYYGQLSDQRSRILRELKLEPLNYCLATVHRAENTDDAHRLRSIFKALDAINRDHKVVIPLHPRTKAKLAEFHIESSCTLVEPVGYFDMIQLIGNSRVVLTDSGGLQKEAYFFKKLCVTLRNETEWTELVDNGYNFLAGADQEKISEYFGKCLTTEKEFAHCLYGDGKASEKTVDNIKSFLNAG